MPRETASLERATRTLNFFHQSVMLCDRAVAGIGFASLRIDTQPRIVGLLSNFKTTGGQPVPVAGTLTLPARTPAL